MSAFKQLRDISNDFELQLRTANSELFSTNIGESFEDGICKKLRNLNFLTSKLRFLKAKQVASTPQVTQQPKSEATIKDYGELATWKVLEQSIVKSLTQSHAVKTLVTTPDRNLDPEMVQRKEKIIDILKQYRLQETELRHLQTVFQEKEDELTVVRQLWDEQLSSLREMKESSQGYDHSEDCGPYYKKLSQVVNKLELMRWLVCRLVCARGSRDWLAEPHRTGRLLALTRTRCSVDSFINS